MAVVQQTDTHASACAYYLCVPSIAREASRQRGYAAMQDSLVWIPSFPCSPPCRCSRRPRSSPTVSTLRQHGTLSGYKGTNVGVIEPAPRPAANRACLPPIPAPACTLQATATRRRPCAAPSRDPSARRLRQHPSRPQHSLRRRGRSTLQHLPCTLRPRRCNRTFRSRTCRSIHL